MIIKRRGSPKVQAFQRETVIAFLVQQNGTQNQAAAYYQLSGHSVGRIWQYYKEDGEKVIVAKKRGVNKNSGKLNSLKARHIRRLIRRCIADEWKLPFSLWTSQAVQQLMFNKYYLAVRKKQVGQRLRAWGYTPQKLIRKTSGQNPQAIAQRPYKDFSQLKREVIKQQADLYSNDGTDMRSGDQIAGSNAFIDSTPVTKATDKHFSANLNAAISNVGQVAFIIVEDRFNGGVFPQFLLELIRYKRRKIYFVTDRYPAHKTARLKDGLAKNQNRIEPIFLPAYSPELNPPEYVSQDAKTNIVGKKRPMNKEPLCKNAKQFLIERKSNPDQIKKYFHHEKVKCAA